MNNKEHTSSNRTINHRNKALILMVVLLSIFLSSCSTVDLFKTKTIIKAPDVIHPGAPIAPSIIDFNMIVANRDELEKLINDTDGEFAYFILTPEGYEIVIKNFNELRRYIENQKQIILYYRKIFKDERNE